MSYLIKEWTVALSTDQNVGMNIKSQTKMQKIFHLNLSDEAPGLCILVALSRGVNGSGPTQTFVARDVCL